jgi:hypothetical protein
MAASMSFSSSQTSMPHGVAYSNVGCTLVRSGTRCPLESGTEPSHPGSTLRAETMPASPTSPIRMAIVGCYRNEATAMCEVQPRGPLEVNLSHRHDQFMSNACSPFTSDAETDLSFSETDTGLRSSTLPESEVGRPEINVNPLSLIRGDWRSYRDVQPVDSKSSAFVK